MDDTRRLLLYLVLVLNISGTVPLLCGSEFADVQSRAVGAGIVLQARVDTTYERQDNHRFNVSIGISKIIRGSIGADLLRGSEEGVNSHVLGKIRVGEFGPQDDAQCLTERQSLIMGGQKFIFFLKRSLESGYYTQSSLPVQSSKTVLRAIRKILCNGCVKPASIRNSNRLVRKTVMEGSRVRLRCRIMGAPTPLVVWTKDEKVLRRRKAMRIRNSNESYSFFDDEKSSVLRLRRVRLKDAGRYVCTSRNIAGQARREFYLAVTPAQPPEHSTSTESPSISSSSSSTSSSLTTLPSVQTTPSTAAPRSTLHVPMSGHYYPCEEQTYCLNGGVCVYLPEFDAEHCRCPANYMGKRCEIRDIFTLLKEITSAESRQHQRRLYTIVGIVSILVLILIITFICCYRLRRSRPRRREKLTAREELQINYTPVPLPPGARDFPDGRTPRRMNSQTQTEPIDLALFIPSYPYLHHNRGRSVDVSPPRQPLRLVDAPPRPPHHGSLELPARDESPAGRREARSLEPRGRERYLPIRGGSFRTKRELGQWEVPRSSPRSSTPASLPTVRDVGSDSRPSPARARDPPALLRPVAETFLTVAQISAAQSGSSSRLPTPDSTADFLAADTPDTSLYAGSRGESKASILSIDMYDSSHVISDVNVSELSVSEDELTDLGLSDLTDLDQTDLDEKLQAVPPVIFNGFQARPRTLKAIPVSANGDSNLTVIQDRI